MLSAPSRGVIADVPDDRLRRVAPFERLVVILLNRIKEPIAQRQ